MKTHFIHFAKLILPSANLCIALFAVWLVACVFAGSFAYGIGWGVALMGSTLTAFLIGRHWSVKPAEQKREPENDTRYRPFADTWDNEDDECWNNYQTAINRKQCRCCAYVNESFAEYCVNCGCQF